MEDQASRLTIVNDEEVLFHHKGEVTKEKLLVVISELETILEELQLTKLLTKRIVYIAIECLQNLQLHGYAENGKYIVPPEFKLTKNKTCINIVIGNTIGSKDALNLEDKLNKINSLDNEELKYLFSVVMKHSGVRISSKSGAGLGLIDMRKKSTQKLGYSFQKINDQHQYLNLKVCLPQDL